MLYAVVRLQDQEGTICPLEVFPLSEHYFLPGVLEPLLLQFGANGHFARKPAEVEPCRGRNTAAPTK